jgi:nicotinamide mononucleotide adenylyltransferase
MKNYRSFILEAKTKSSNTVVMAFGRMNPPTTGHAKLVDKVRELAQQHDAHHEIILSHSHDSEKNPLTQAQKIKHAKRYFPGANITGSSSEQPNFLEHAKRLHQAGHDHLVMVAGDDRVGEYQKILNKYNGSHEGALFNFKKISVVSAGSRDPDAEGVEGMSASKMREHAKNNNFDGFRQGVPSHVSDKHAKELFNDVRKGIGIKEEQVNEACWDGYKQVGMKKKNSRMVPNCVPEESSVLNKPTMSPEEIAKKHKVDVSEIQKQLKVGIGVEKEHTKNEDTAREIALDHLGENPKYYAKLKKYVESVVKVGTMIQDDFGEVGKVVSLRENAVVFNVLQTGMMKSVEYGYFDIVESIGHIATGAPDYFFGGVADAPKDKQEEAGHSDPSPQDKDIRGKKHSTPSKYYRGLSSDTKKRRYSDFRQKAQKSWKDPSAYTDAPGDKEAREKDMPQSKHTKKYHALYDERINNSQMRDDMNEEASKGLAAKAKKSGISLSTLRKVYNRGMAAWRSGHRPGTTPQQWAMARVNSYITKGKGTYYGADADLRKENISTDYVGTGMNVPYYGSYDKVAVHNEGKDIDKMFEEFLEENVHALDTNMESHLFGTNAARKAAEQMTPGEPGYVGQNKKLPDSAYHSREGEETNQKEKKTKKSQEEDYAGADYNSRLSGSPRAVGGLGGAYSIGIQENMLPNVPSIRAWALKEATQRNFIQRYGDDAGEKLLEAAYRMTTAKSSFISFRQKLDEADYAPQAFSMGSGSSPVLSPPETGYAKQAFGESKKKPKMEKVNEDEVTFHCEEDELIETLQWDEETHPIEEAEYQGKKVPLGKPMKGDVKKSKVYVKGPSGRVVKVNFGDKNMTIKKNIPARRKSFRARHHCDTNPGPRWKARYWSCRAW